MHVFFCMLRIYEGAQPHPFTAVESVREDRLLYLNENHSHLAPPITHFCPNVKGFIWVFWPFFSGIFLDISCTTCHNSYVN